MGFWNIELYCLGVTLEINQSLRYMKPIPPIWTMHDWTGCKKLFLCLAQMVASWSDKSICQQRKPNTACIFSIVLYRMCQCASCRFRGGKEVLDRKVRQTYATENILNLNVWICWFRLLTSSTNRDSWEFFLGTSNSRFRKTFPFDFPPHSFTRLMRAKGITRWGLR